MAYKSTFMGYCCVDCVAYINNGDHIAGHDRAAFHRIQKENREFLNATHGHYSTAGNGETNFMKTPCETCGSTLAGNREQVFMLHNGKDE
jgi:ribosomal protein S27E